MLANLISQEEEGKEEEIETQRSNDREEPLLS